MTPFDRGFITIMNSNITLRPYQKEAINACMEWVKKNSVGGVCATSGGSGKSIMIAEVARLLHEMTGKYVLVVVPNVDLLRQNCEKLDLIGCKYSMYSASASQKSLRHPIVVTTEGTWKKVAKEKAHLFCAVLVDEGDRTTDTLKQIMDDMRDVVPLIRLLAFTGTPFRLTEGWIYELDLEGRIVEEAKNPFYKKLIYELGCNELIAMGYLTPVQVGFTDSSYDTSGLKLKGDDFTASSVKEAFEGKESVTKKIIDEVIVKTKDKKGVMIFASTIKHSEEICSYLPVGSYVFLHGKMGKEERKQAVARFKNQECKYLVNKDIACVGFDAPHVDCIVLLRATSSNRLFLQIVWRAVRLYEGKTHSVILDYANNIKNLFGDSEDIFTPQIKAYGSKPQTKIEISCPECSTTQEASKKPKHDNFDEHGYCIDLAGDLILVEGQPLPAHYLRRCRGVVSKGKNVFERCDYHWSFKSCPECGEKNDIAARSCTSCGLTLISPDAKLSDVAHIIKQGEKYTANVNALTVNESANGGVMYAIFDTPHGEIKAKFYPNNTNRFVAQHANIFNRATECGEKRPTQIEYSLKKDGYYVIHRYIPPFVENV